MRDPKPPVDLTALEADFDIVGELGSTGDAKILIASRKGSSPKRRDDESAVVIEVVGVPEGDEGNALSHLAADTKRLSATAHRRLVRVLDGRWLGERAFAVIRERVTDPTLAQLLATGERFSNPRIAAILREVNGLLEWAREQMLTHRAITPDRIYLEPKTDRVRVAFAASAIPRLQGTNAPSTDARTIARLAAAMLAGVAKPRSDDVVHLAERRPDLPDQLINATRSLFEGIPGIEVAAYLALIGMADPLAAGETEAERIREEILAEQLTEREKFAIERARLEKAMEEQRQTLERGTAAERETMARDLTAAEEAMARERAELLDQLESDRQAMAHQKEELLGTLASERETMARQLESERATMARELDSERGTMAREREELLRVQAQERAALVSRREELERTAAEQRVQLERAAMEDRRRIDALREELKRAGELEIEKKRQAALDEITDTDSELDKSTYATPAFQAPAIVPLERPSVEALVVSSSTRERRPWVKPSAKAFSAMAAGAIIATAVAALTIGRRSSTASIPPAGPVPVVTSTSTSGGAVARNVVPATRLSPVDPGGVRVVGVGTPAEDSINAALRRRRMMLARDSVVRDSVIRARIAARARMDTIVRTDSATRPDSLQR